jgi:putative membrane fusion protein
MKGYQIDVKRKAILFLGFIFLILLSLNLLPRLFGENDIYVVPEDFEYEVRIPAQGIIARDEKLYYSSSDGDVFKVVKEGERVRVGQKVVDILLLEDTTDLKEELNHIDNMIQFYDDLNKNNDGEDAEDSNGIDLLVSKLYQQLAEEDYQGINATKESILLYNETVNSFSGDDEGAGLTTEELLARRDYLLSRISKYNKSIHSVYSGIVSYEIDGWEEDLAPDRLSELGSDIFDVVESGENFENGAVFKIIDDYQWHLLIDVSDGESSSFKVGDVHEIVVGTDDNDNLVEARMPIVDIVEDGSDKIYIFKGTNFINKIFNKRFVNVEIVDFREETLRIPVESIVEIDGAKGVKVKEFYGVVTFRPVEIIALDDRYAYVSKGDNNGYIEVGEESLRTISLFSEVIVKPDSVELGEILN